MRVAIVQPSYIPWRGFFDMIRSVDLFLFFDDVQYTRHDWRNRNRIKTAAGPRWLTIPVRRHAREEIIRNIAICYEPDWRAEHLNLLRVWYGRTPFYERYAGRFADILATRPESLCDLDIALTRWLMEELGIATAVERTSRLPVTGAKTDRLLALLGRVGATDYLSGPAAKDYIDPDAFQRAGVGLCYKRYDYAAYPQPWGDFLDFMSVLDLLFNTGPEAPGHLRNLTGDERVVPAGRPAAVIR